VQVVMLETAYNSVQQVKSPEIAADQEFFGSSRAKAEESCFVAAAAAAMLLTSQ
jgi:hypothetical protein